MITIRLILGYTGRQTMGTESHQEPSGVHLSNYAKEQHFCVLLAVEVHILEMNHSKLLLTNLWDMNIFCRSLTSNPGLTGPIPAEISNLAVLQILKENLIK
jgi:hypothetical protein